MTEQEQKVATYQIAALPIGVPKDYNFDASIRASAAESAIKAAASALTATNASTAAETAKTTATTAAATAQTASANAENYAKSASDSAASAEAKGAQSWNATTTYNYPDVVAYTDGNTYRCVGTNITGIAPGTTSDWVKLPLVQAVVMSEIYPLFVQRNKTYNAGDMVFAFTVRPGLMLDCVQAGTTGADDLVLTGKVQGNEITDGTVKWKLRMLSTCFVRDNADNILPQD